MKPAAPTLRTPEAGGPSPEAAQLSDEALMERFLAGDARAFDSLFMRYAKPLHAYLVRVIGPSLAEDLTQTTFLSAVRSRERFQPGARVRPWFYAIATNAARDAMRRRRPEDLTAEGSLPQIAAEEVRPRDLGLERAVHEALQKIPAAQREAIILHRFEGLSFGEIAEALGLSESAIKVRAHRGYLRLRELLSHLREDSL